MVNIYNGENSLSTNYLYISATYESLKLDSINSQNLISDNNGGSEYALDKVILINTGKGCSLVWGSE